MDKRTTTFVLASSGVLVLWSAVCAWLNAGPITASIITYILYISYWLYAVKYKNPLVLRLLIIGTIAGVLELLADHYLVDTIDSLVYPGNELMIWSSPAYMPFAWSNVLLQLGFVGILLVDKFGLWIASILLCLAGGMYIPLYEHLAKDAGWWYYHQNTLMLFNAPVYVIVCEALISLSLPLFVTIALKHRMLKVTFLGLICGIWIFIAAVFSFSLIQSLAAS